MPLYEYEAKTTQGLIVRGKLDAADEAAVMVNLRGKNCYPIMIKPYKEALNIDLDNFKKISLKDISIFCRQFAFMVSSGISILRALELLKEQTDNAKLRKILGEVYSDVQKGKTISDSMKNYKDFPAMLISMTEAAEASGTLESAMDRMSQYYEREYKFNQKVSQALMYPMIVCIFSVVVIIILSTYVLPNFVGIISEMGGGELPLPTRIIMWFSNVIKTKGIFIALAAAIMVMLFKMYSRSDNGGKKIDKIKLSIPLIGKLNNMIAAARFARTFASLMGSGIAIISSIEITAGVVGNKVIVDALQYVKEDLKRGDSLGNLLEIRNIFPNMLVQMIKIGEESGTLDAIMEKTADFYDNEVENMTTKMTTLIEPIIILILAIVVGSIVISMILPMFQMYNTINGT